MAISYTNFSGGVNAINPLDTDFSLRDNANYLYNLCNRYIKKAISIYNGNDGGIVVNPSMANLYSYIEITLSVDGTIGQPIANTSTYQNDLLIGARYLNEFSINQQIFYIKTATNPNGSYTLNTTTGTITFESYVWNTGDIAVLSFETLNK